MPNYYVKFLEQGMKLFSETIVHIPDMTLQNNHEIEFQIKSELESNHNCNVKFIESFKKVNISRSKNNQLENEGSYAE